MIKLKESLDSNWTYIHKILFTFTFYLIYKVFVRAIGFEEMKPYSLIFIIIGFLVFTMDSWIGRFISFLKIFSSQKSGTQDKLTSIVVISFLFLMIILGILFFITGYYPYVSLSIFTGITSILISYYFLDFRSEKFRKISKWMILTLIIPGLAGIVHSFYYNDVLNIFNFIFIIGFFILENRLFYWKTKNT